MGEGIHISSERKATLWKYYRHSICQKCAAQCYKSAASKGKTGNINVNARKDKYNKANCNHFERSNKKSQVTTTNKGLSFPHIRNNSKQSNLVDNGSNMSNLYNSHDKEINQCVMCLEGENISALRRKTLWKYHRKNICKKCANKTDNLNHTINVEYTLIV